MLKRSFTPIAGPETRIFILGSLPGDRSLAEQRYYGHPTNQFWKLVGAATGEPLQALGYDERLERLAARGIGLWDVISAAEREGSLDSSIRSLRHNALGGLRDAFPKLTAIAFNGGRATREGRPLLSGVEGIRFYDLISSSGAAARPFDEKAAIWKAIAPHLIAVAGRAL